MMLLEFIKGGDKWIKSGEQPNPWFNPRAQLKTCRLRLKLALSTLISWFQSWAASVGVGFKPWIVNQPGFCIWIRLVINPPDRYQAGWRQINQKNVTHDEGQSRMHPSLSENSHPTPCARVLKHALLCQRGVKWNQVSLDTLALAKTKPT